MNVPSSGNNTGHGEGGSLDWSSEKHSVIVVDQPEKRGKRKRKGQKRSDSLLRSRRQQGVAVKNLGRRAWWFYEKRKKKKERGEGGGGVADALPVDVQAWRRRPEEHLSKNCAPLSGGKEQ